MSQRNPSRPMPFLRNQWRPESNWVGCINDLVTCPYNSSHVMKYHKLMLHLIKCEKQQLKIAGATGLGLGVPDGFEKCPYNSLHRYPSGKQDEHFQECKARADELFARLASGEDLEGVDERYTYKSSSPNQAETKTITENI